MTYQTDERLKGYLDTNQLHREQMCLAILAIDKRFSEVRPRHPRGGPDGGRDIEAVFKDNQRVFGAVGFVNQADDSSEKKKKIKEKFGDDLISAISASPPCQVFVFLTNVNLTVGEKDELTSQARAKGLSYCEIFDRERLRIALDSADGFAIRFQFLSLALSDAEQSSFFARWGDDIQSVISTGFQSVHSTLDRILFLQEAGESMSSLLIGFELDRTYSADEIGHFRAFCSMQLKEPKLKIFSIVFGSSDKSDRMRNDRPESERDLRSGIKFGISGGQWEQKIDLPGDPGVDSPDDSDAEATDEMSEDEVPEKYTQAGWSSSAGQNEAKFIRAQYEKDSFFRFFPTLTVRDINDAMFMPILNASLADKVKCIHVFANEYKLLEIPKQDFVIDKSEFAPSIPVDFSAEELGDPWVRIRPNGPSAFRISFSEQTPHRVFSPRQTQNSLGTRKKS
jgi:hypothetical protein